MTYRLLQYNNTCGAELQANSHKQQEDHIKQREILLSPNCKYVCESLQNLTLCTQRHCPTKFSGCLRATREA